MLEVDFSNCRDEWWHYSWGDAGWAVRMSETECFLRHSRSSAPSYYEELERLHIESMKERVNPFLPRAGS